MLAPSRFNFAVEEPGPGARVAVFNAFTGVLLVLDGGDSAQLANCLQQPAARLTSDDLPNQLFDQLLSGGFLVADGTDEIAPIRERYWRARGETPVVITVTTTMDCNLGCYYCYEERSGAKLMNSDVNDLVSLVIERVHASRAKRVHVDWYGGEPLLNVSFIEAGSAAVQAACDERGIAYVASVISNGSAWPDDVENFVRRHRIRQVQISFDGMRQHHDKRRRYRKHHAPSDGAASSFDRAVALVDRLVKCVRVDLRFNIDRGNMTDMLPFVDFACERGWFAAPHPAVLQPARIAAYTESSSFVRSRGLTLSEFDTLRAQVRERVRDMARIEESEVPDGYPYPKTSVCAALAMNSAVLGADGMVYRCGLQVGERKRAVGKLSDSGLEFEDTSWWSEFDPAIEPTCSVCSFLPICWGGCPKKHLDGDRYALLEQGRYWRTNLPRLVAKAAGFAQAATSEIDEALQFRSGVTNKPCPTVDESRS